MNAPVRVFSVRRFLFLLVPALAIAALGAGYVAWIEPKSFPYPLKLKGFLQDGLVVPTKLDQGLVDADGNLVADPPPLAEQIDPDTLKFGVLESDRKGEEKDYADFLKHLSAATGKKIELVPVDDVQPSDLRKGNVHLVNLATGSVSTAVNLGGAVPFCVMADDAGKYAYRMELIVPADSPIRSPSEFRGKDIAFVSVYSLSGFKAPVVTLWKKFNMQPGRDYDLCMQGSHKMLVEGIAKGRLKGGAVASDYLKRLVARGTIDGTLDEKSIRRIYESPEEYPPACYAYSHRLKPELADKIKKAFFSFKWEGTSLAEAYKAAGQTKFVPISYKEDWAHVREMEHSALELVQHLVDEKK